MKIVITYFILLLLSFFYGKTEKLPIDTVLFSSDSKYVLAFDFFIDACYQKQVWHLYDKENLDDNFNMNISQSILFENDTFYLSDYINTDDSSGVIKNNKININEFIEKYNLVDVATEITNNVSYKITICDSLIWEEELSNELYDVQEVIDYKLKMDYVFNDKDTFYTFYIPKVSAFSYNNCQAYLNTTINELNIKRPEIVYDEEYENLRKGVRRYYTTIFLSSKNQYFINSNFEIDTYSDTEVESEDKGGELVAYTIYTVFGGINYKIRVTK